MSKKDSKTPRYNPVTVRTIEKFLKRMIGTHGLEVVRYASNKTIKAESGKRKLVQQIKEKEAELAQMRKQA